MYHKVSKPNIQSYYVFKKKPFIFLKKDTKGNFFNLVFFFVQLRVKRRQKKNDLKKKRILTFLYMKYNSV